jgi:osmotically-inducible protein OsmY
MTNLSVHSRGIPGNHIWIILVSALLIIGLTSVPGTLSGAVQENNLEDERITDAIKMGLIFNDATPEHLLDLETKDGVVTITGTVSNLLAKENAVNVAKAVKGVRSVVDRIDVVTKGRSDSKTREYVIEALKSDPATERFDVSVTVEDNVVTLSGQVESWAEHRLAEKAVKGVVGVADINNLLTVKFKEDRPDSEIKADVERMLEIDATINDELIDVAVEDAKVKLSGTVGSAAEFARAMDIAWVNGVKDIQADDLNIKWWLKDRLTPRTAALTDLEIKNAVKDALFHDPRVMSFNPEVRVRNGRVTLTGEVSNLAAKRAAQDTALNTVGVRYVWNLLRVRPDELTPKKELVEKVERALSRDPFLERFDITVTALMGKVYLSGVVDSAFEKDRAQEVASRVNGVIAVDNNLTMTQGWTWKDDWELKEDVESQLFWSPFVDSDRVTVSVDHGTVTLKGSVADWSEYRAARDNALQAGAKDVDNNLTIKDTDWF